MSSARNSEDQEDIRLLIEKIRVCARKIEYDTSEIEDLINIKNPTSEENIIKQITAKSIIAELTALNEYLNSLNKLNTDLKPHRKDILKKSIKQLRETGTSLKAQDYKDIGNELLKATNKVENTIDKMQIPRTKFNKSNFFKADVKAGKTTNIKSLMENIETRAKYLLTMPISQSASIKSNKLCNQISKLADELDLLIEDDTVKQLHPSMIKTLAYVNLYVGVRCKNLKEERELFSEEDGLRSKLLGMVNYYKKMKTGDAIKISDEELKALGNKILTDSEPNKLKTVTDETLNTKPNTRPRSR